MTKTFTFLFALIFATNSFGQSYKKQLDSLNQFLKTFNEGVYGYFEVKGNDIYGRFKSGTYCMASINDIDKAYVDADNKTVYLKCKKDTNCMTASWLGYNIVGTYMSDHINPKPNTKKFAQLINDFLDAVRSPGTNTIASNKTTTNPSTSGNTETNNVKNQNPDKNPPVSNDNKYNDVKYLGYLMFYVANTGEVFNAFSFEIYGKPGTVLSEKDKQILRSKVKVRIDQWNSNITNQFDHFKIQEEYFYVNSTEKEVIKKVKEQLNFKTTKAIDQKIYRQGKYVLPGNSDFPIANNNSNTNTPPGNTEIFKKENGFFEISNATLFEDQKFYLKQKMFRVNKRNNKIEQIDLETNTITPIIEFSNGENLERAVQLNKFIYYATKENKEYAVYKYDPTLNQSTKIKIVSNKKGNGANLAFFENDIISDEKLKSFISLETNGNTLYIKYGVTKIFLQEYNHNVIKIEYYSILENKNEAVYIDEEIESRREMKGYINNSNINYSFRTLCFAFKNNSIVKGISNIRTKAEGGYYRSRYLLSADFNDKENKFKESNPYSFSYKIKDIDYIFNYNGRLFILCSFEDSTNSNKKTNVLFEFLSSNQPLEAIEVLGTGDKDKPIRYICTNDNIYIKSFNVIYEFDLSTNKLNEIVSFDENTVIGDFKVSPNGNINYSKTTTEPSGKREEFFLFSSTDKRSVNLSSIRKDDGDNLNGKDFGYYLATSQTNDHFFKFNYKYGGHLYKLNFQNNTASLILPPNIGILKYSKVIEHSSFEKSPYTFMKIEYLNNNIKEVKYLVYKCQ